MSPDLLRVLPPGVIHDDDLTAVLRLLEGEDPESTSQASRYLKLSHRLKRALIDKQINVDDSNSSTGHEIYSSLPTYGEAVSSLDPIYSGISFASLGIAGLIKYRGLTEDDELSIALAIWAEFRQNREKKHDTGEEEKAVLKNSFDVLEVRMAEHSHVFYATPEHDLGQFKAHVFDDLAKARGLWADPSEAMLLKTSLHQKLRASFSKAAKNFNLTDSYNAFVKFTFGHMVVDMATKWSERETWRDIRNGFACSASYFRDFKVFSSVLRDSKRATASQKELRTTRRLEDHDVIPTLIEKGQLDPQKVENMIARRAAIRKDVFLGKIFNYGFILETAFFAGHAIEGLVNGFKVASYHAGHSLMGNRETVQLPHWLLTEPISNSTGDIVMSPVFFNPSVHKAVTEFFAQQAQGPDHTWSFLLNVYSILMVLGAYAFLGGQSSSIRERIRNNEQYLHRAYGEIEAAYKEAFGGKSPAPTPAA